MLYDLGKKCFKLFINFLHSLQIVLIFLSFSVILFWLLQLGKVPFIDFVAPFFEGIKSFIHLFYNRTIVVDEVSIDFSFFIAALLFMALVLILKFAAEQVEFVEQKYDSAHRYLKRKTEDVFNTGLNQQYLFDEQKNNKFFMFIRFKAKNMMKDSLYNKDAHEGESQKEKEFLFDFFEVLDDLKCQKRNTQSGILLYFDNFNEVDSIISSVDTMITEIKNKYLLDKWKIESLMAAETYADENEIPQKVQNAIKLLNLGFKGEIACLAGFKQRYSLIKQPQYQCIGRGVYKINKDEEVFCIKRI